MHKTNSFRHLPGILIGLAVMVAGLLFLISIRPVAAQQPTTYPWPWTADYADWLGLRIIDGQPAPRAVPASACDRISFVELEHRDIFRDLLKVRAQRRLANKRKKYGAQVRYARRIAQLEHRLERARAFFVKPRACGWVVLRQAIAFIPASYVR